MLNGYNYIVLTEDFGKNGQHKYRASVIRVYQGNNLLSELANYPKATHANICGTKKEAEDIMDLWNDSYLNNKTLASINDITA